MKTIFTAIIRIYQKYLSFDTGILRFITPFGACRFYPSCSHYSHEALRKYGLVTGLWLSVRRVLRCHPLSKGGLDPVPELKPLFRESGS